MNYGIQPLKNTYGGEITMVGNGPSLDFDNIESPSLGVNSISLAFPNTDWRPDLFVCTTRLLLANEALMKRIRFVLELGIPCFLNSDYYKELGDWPNAYYVGSARADHDPLPGDWLQDGCWVYCYASVMVAASQIAQYLGFTQYKFTGIDGYKSYIGNADVNHFDDAYNEGLMVDGWGCDIHEAMEINRRQALAFEHIKRNW